MKVEDAAGREHIPFVVKALGLSAGRSAFAERVFDYLESAPWLLVGERLLRIQLESVRVVHQTLGTQVEITFTLGEPGSAPSARGSKDPRELAGSPAPEVEPVTIVFGQQVLGDQIFHFTFDSRQDFEINLLELETMVEALYRSPDERRAIDQFFYDRLHSFMRSSEKGKVSEEPVTLPPPAGRSPRIEQERIRLRRLLRQLLFYHFYSFLSVRKKDRSISVLLIILPVLIGAFVSFRDVSDPSIRLIVALASLGIAVIASLRVVFDLPALAEEHRHFSNKCRELLRDLEQATSETPSGSTSKDIELKLARIKLQVQDLSALSPGNFHSR